MLTSNNLAQEPFAQIDGDVQDLMVAHAGAGEHKGE